MNGIDLLSKGMRGFDGAIGVTEGMRSAGMLGSMSGYWWLFPVLQVVGFVLLIVLVVFLFRRKRKNMHLDKLKEQYVLGNLTDEEYNHKKEVLTAK